MKHTANNKFSKKLKIKAVFGLIFAIIFSGCVENGHSDVDNSSEQKYQTDLNN